MSVPKSVRKILLLGGTGPTGLEIIAQARAAGVAVRALARNPAKLHAAGGVEVVRGDVLDPVSLEPALAGVDAVVSSIGTPLTRQPVTLLSAGTRNLVEAMRKASVRRLLCITGMGAGDSKGHGGFLYDRILLPLLLKSIYADKDRQEHVVRASGLEWTLIRPAMLTSGPLTGKYRVITRFTDEKLGKISRQDVAHFVLSELADQRYSGMTANISY